MNQDENQTGQQGYGQDPTSQQQQQPQAQQSQQQPQGQQGSNDFETGQASYGNSGQADALTQSQNSSDMGQDADMGQAASGQGSGSQGSGFIGSGSSGNDMGSSSGQSEGMPLGTAGGGYGGSADTTGGQSSSGMAQAGSSDQDFADQGQGAMNEDLMGSEQDDDDDLGTTDIETERSQGRETTSKEAPSNPS